MKTCKDNCSQHAEQIICLGESNTKIRASMLLVAMGTIHMYRGTNSVATLFTSGSSCNACHLPAALQTIPLEKDIQPPPGRAPPTPNTQTHTHALQCGFAKAAGDSYHGDVDSYLFCTRARQQVSSVM